MLRTGPERSHNSSVSSALPPFPGFNLPWRNGAKLSTRIDDSASSILDTNAVTTRSSPTYFSSRALRQSPISTGMVSDEAKWRRHCSLFHNATKSLAASLFAIVETFFANTLAPWPFASSCIASCARFSPPLKRSEMACNIGAARPSDLPMLPT